jgi:hypothetical protein
MGEAISECTTFDRQMSRVETNRTALARFPAADDDEPAENGNKGFGAANQPREHEGPAEHAAPASRMATIMAFVPQCHTLKLAMHHQRSFFSVCEFETLHGAE